MPGPAQATLAQRHSVVPRSDTALVPASALAREAAPPGPWTPDGERQEPYCLSPLGVLPTDKEVAMRDNQEHRPKVVSDASSQVRSATDPCLSLRTIAGHTETSVAFWRKVIARRLIPLIRVGRPVRIRKSDLSRFLDARERPAQEPKR